MRLSSSLSSVTHHDASHGRLKLHVFEAYPITLSFPSSRPPYPPSSPLDHLFAFLLEQASLLPSETYSGSHTPVLDAHNLYGDDDQVDVLMEIVNGDKMNIKSCRSQNC